MNMKEIGLGKALAMTYRAGRMTPGERKELAQKRLKELTAYAGQNSPYYGRLYKGLPEDWKLTDLPTVNKVDLMAHFDMWLTDRTVTEEAVNSFMEDRENIGRLMDGKYLIFTTSGSTGSPLVVLYDKTCMNISSALSVLRAYARKEDLSAFIKKGKRTASIFAEGFYLGSGSVKDQLHRMPWKKGMMMNLDVRTPTAEIVEKLNRFSPVMLGGYPSGLELLADEQAAGRLHISPAIVMTGGELLRDEVREKLADAFGGYVQTNYSCTEGGTMCHECVNRHLHINDEWIMIEAVDEDNRPVPDGTQSAKILLTNLANKVQPFIRYEVSDRIVMHHEECGCGCDAPWLEIEGRNDDILMFEITHMAIKKFPDLSIQYLEKSKFDYIEKIKGLKIDFSFHNTIPMLPNERIQAMFNIDRDTPIIKVNNTTFLENGDVMDFTEQYMNSPKYQLNYIRKR